MRKILVAALFGGFLLLALSACTQATPSLEFPTATLPGLSQPSPEPAIPTNTEVPVVIEPSPTTRPTDTQVPANTPVSPGDGVSPTATAIPPTATSVAPTATSIPPTATSVAPTATSIAPTATSIAPTATTAPVLRIEALTTLFAFGEKDAWGQTGYPGDGGKYWRLINTSDGGKTWKVVSPPGGYPSESRYFAYDKNTAWVASAAIPASGGVENGFVYATLDRGKNWTKSSAIPLATNGETAKYFMPQALYFMDKNTGWLVASVARFSNQDVLVIFMTTDGGKNWVRQTDKFAAGSGGGASLPCTAYSIAFVNASRGWLAGNCLAVSLDERWKVLETNDGGKTWAQVDMPAPANAPEAVTKPNTTDHNVACGTRDIQVVLPSTAVLEERCLVTSGGNTATYTFTYVSIDSGATWNGAQVSGASFYAAAEGYAIGPWVKSGVRYIMQTKDGGKTWKDVYRLAWPEASLDFSSGLHGWSVVKNYSPNRGVWGFMLLRTADGGGNWWKVDVYLP